MKNHGSPGIEIVLFGLDSGQKTQPTNQSTNHKHTHTYTPQKPEKQPQTPQTVTFGRNIKYPPSTILLEYFNYIIYFSLYIIIICYYIIIIILCTITYVKSLF